MLSTVRAGAIKVASSSLLRNIAIVSSSLLIAWTVIFWWNDERSDDVGVSREWNDTISRLGIEPVYPAEEDIAVGDVYAILTGDSSARGDPSPLLGRSIKLAKIDLTNELDKYYKSLYLFPETAQRPIDASEIWRQKESDRSLFHQGEQRRLLPLVLLPGIAINKTRSAAGRINGTLGSVLASIGLSSRDNQNVEVRIPFVESYGLPSLVSTGKLYEFCQDKRTSRVCTHDGARSQLSMIVGKHIFERLPDGRYRYDVEIALVSRVFLTRIVETTISKQDSGSIEASVVADVSPSIKANLDLKKILKAGQVEPDLAATMEQSLDEQRKALEGLQRHLSGEASGGGVASKGSRREVAVSQVLQRPVVIGFRAVRTTLFERQP